MTRLWMLAAARALCAALILSGTAPAAAATRDTTRHQAAFHVGAAVADINPPVHASTGACGGRRG